MSGRPNSASFDAIDVRRIRPDEWREHRELRLQALARDPLAFGSTHSRERGFSDDLWKERTERGALSESSALFIADSGGTGFVGMVAVARPEGQWHVFAMWVSPEFRRRGIGGRLLDAGLTWFRERTNSDPLLLDVNPRQVDAVRLYEHRGFRRTGGTAPLGHIEGEITVSMVLDPMSQR